MKLNGQKLGFVFFIVSILLTLTVVGPAMLPLFAELIGAAISALFNTGNISGTTYHSCVVLCILAFLIYLLSLMRYRRQSLAFLLIFFLCLFIFLNAALFYYPIRHPDAHIDGQQIFDSIHKPLQTSWLYMVFGLAHDFFMKKVSKGKQDAAGDSVSKPQA